MALVATRPEAKPRPLLSLTAAASERKLGAFIINQITQEGWQSRNWEFYRSLGAVHYGVNFKRNAAAKVSYFAAEKTDFDPEPTENQRVIDAVARLQSRFGDINEIVAELMIHVNVPGEGYLVGEEGLDGEEWDVWSAAEVNAARNAAMPKPDQALFDSNAFLCRIWRPDPEHRHLADSPLRPVADQCEQLLLLDDSIAAAAKSRLSAGFLLVPSELDIGEQKAFEDALIAILTTPIKETDSAARWSPGLIRGPAEFLEKISLLSFGREIDATFAEMREELTRSIAAGLDLPAEIVTGKGDLSHWNAWEIDESAFRDHIDPDIVLILDSITRGYLHPALIEGGMGEEEAANFLIWRDLSDLGQRPPSIPEATALWDRRIISDGYMRGLINASDEDMPEEEEVPAGVAPMEATGQGIPRDAPGQNGGAVAMGIEGASLGEKVNAAGVLIRSGFDPEASLKAMGLPPITHLGFLPVTIKTDVPPDPAAAVLDPNAPDPGPTQKPQPVPPALVATARGRPLTELSSIDRRLLDRITEASEAAFNRVLERAGAKIRSHAKKDRAISMTIDKLSNDMVTRHLGEKLIAQLQITPADLVPSDSFDPLLKRLRVIMDGAASEVETVLEGLTGVRPGLNAAQIQGALGHYVTQLEGFSVRLLFNPLDPGPGEVGDSQIPQGLVMDMMTEASGGTPTEGPSDVRGFATGNDSLNFLEANGFTLTGHMWEYGDSSTRQRPFPPHRRLDLVEFTDWDDERLATPASASFLNVGHMFPGDHFRCQCRSVPVAIEPEAEPAAPPDPPNMSTDGMSLEEAKEYAAVRADMIKRYPEAAARVQHWGTGEDPASQAAFRVHLQQQVQFSQGPGAAKFQEAIGFLDNGDFPTAWGRAYGAQVNGVHLDPRIGGVGSTIIVRPGISMGTVPYKVAVPGDWSPVRYTATHEFGHAMEHDLLHRLADRTPLAASVEVSPGYNAFQDAVVRTGHNGRRVSGYGATNINEGFAESFTASEAGAANSSVPQLLELAKQAESWPRFDDARKVGLMSPLEWIRALDELGTLPSYGMFQP